ncbi:nicotinate phosphoribosyltransferase [Paenibacillus sp. N1-5-1-14]|uniref:nicotinate phosphoribosyltransferase n=1 Tax=Paenibacillus radicibacter TaxID=2972488 RepID=UPI0021593356|nr:nicotinate phosphoribosyltransferase [Paenibacillus radicibacter]MCR8645555.1 nicotinate phosphoribosyltransferase [Paenibacillus radicibacter]
MLHTHKNITLHTDKYQINMMYAHWANGTHNNKAVFEAYIRKLPFGNGFAVFAGLHRIVEYINDLCFDDEAIDYLRQQEENYAPEFLEELRKFRFTGDLYAVEEGTLIFPQEPLIRVESRIFEAQLVETAILNFMNFQTLIATKASRIRHVAPEDHLLEFGTRRAQEGDAAIWGSRAAYIAGFNATSNMLAGMLFGIPTSGTHAHSWVQSHESEEEAFMRYAKVLPDQVTLLVDTYDTIKSGVPNAIRIAQYLKEQGKKLNAIRLDSGDLAYLSKAARSMLDEAGFPEVKIVASNDLDEHIIFNLKAQGARIDVWGVGTQLITAADQPSLGGVYKMVAREQDGKIVPTIKISGNPEKVSAPGGKMPYRLMNKNTGKAEADYIALVSETDVASGARLKLFDPVQPYLNKYIDHYEAIPLMKTIFEDGEQVYELPTLDQIRAHHEDQKQQFRLEYLRKLNPEAHPVHLSLKAWTLKMKLLKKYKN